MKKILPLFIIAFLPLFSHAQVIPGYFIQDSTVLNFTGDSSYPSYIIGDTSSSPLWQIGNTQKQFFTAGANSIKAIMTDTVGPYPVKANNWFTVIINHVGADQIVSFWHRYQTLQGLDGGIVEFSLDTGLTWQNALGACNTDGTSPPLSGIRTDNFYSATDTLSTGDAAFSGTSNGTVCSRLQFLMNGFPKLTGGGSCVFIAPIYLRFRFLSSSTSDTLAGWMIDSISLRNDNYEDEVSSVSKTGTLKIYPNPSDEGLFNFPALDNENGFYIEVYNAIGDRILKMPYTHQVGLKSYPNGLYYYKTTNGTEYYSGKLVKD